MLPLTRTREAKSLRRESKRNRAWLFLPSCLLYNRWHGANSHGCIQETSRSNLRETEEGLQQNHQLAQMPPEFLSAQISHHVLARVQVQHSPSSPPFRPTIRHRPRMPRRSNPLTVHLHYLYLFLVIASLPIA